MTPHKSFLVVLASAALAVGCAHHPLAQKPVSPPPMVQPAPALDAATLAQLQERQNFDAMLKNMVIHFDYNADVLTHDSQEQLTQLAKAHRKHADVAIKISGNCDERGTEEYNIALGQRRADVAKKYLASLGLKDAQISTVSYGKESPVDPGHDEAAWSKNRRDEFQAK